MTIALIGSRNLAGHGDECSPSTQKLRPKDLEFKASLSYTVRFCCQKRKEENLDTDTHKDILWWQTLKLDWSIMKSRNAKNYCQPLEAGKGMRCFPLKRNQSLQHLEFGFLLSKQWKKKGWGVLIFCLFFVFCFLFFALEIELSHFSRSFYLFIYVFWDRVSLTKPLNFPVLLPWAPIVLRLHLTQPKILLFWATHFVAMGLMPPQDTAVVVPFYHIHLEFSFLFHQL